MYSCTNISYFLHLDTIAVYEEIIIVIAPSVNRFFEESFRPLAFFFDKFYLFLVQDNYDFGLDLVPFGDRFNNNKIS